MAHSWNLDTIDSISFDDFLDYLRSRGGSLFHDRLDETALYLRRIANNRRFLVEQLNHDLKNLKTFQGNNLYTPQVFMLKVEDRFLIRAAIWEAPRGRVSDEMFFYEDAHDHNFSFFTVGYHGPGYRTRIYEYDHAELIGHPDEPVRLEFLEETTLPLGKVLLFRRGRDVHIQYPPRAVSISVNVLEKLDEPRPDQYFFDLDAGRSLGKADRTPGLVLIRLASALAAEESIDLLGEIMVSHASPRIRLAAYDAVARQRGAATWERAMDDASRLVRHVAAERLRAGSR